MKNHLNGIRKMTKISFTKEWQKLRKEIAKFKKRKRKRV